MHRSSAMREGSVGDAACLILAGTVSVRRQFTDDQVTRSRKLEGQWWADGGAYFVASFARLSDGSRNEHDGQVWFYDPKRRTLTLKVLLGVLGIAFFLGGVLLFRVLPIVLMVWLVVKAIEWLRSDRGSSPTSTLDV